MRQITMAIIACVFIMSGTIGWSRSVPPASAADLKIPRAELVAACKQEAKRGHYRQLHSRIVLEHKQRMLLVCDRLRFEPATEGERAAVLTACLAEASRGPINVNRRGGADRSHVVRLKRMCRALAERS